MERQSPTGAFEFTFRSAVEGIPAVVTELAEQFVSVPDLSKFERQFKNARVLECQSRSASRQRSHVAMALAIRNVTATGDGDEAAILSNSMNENGGGCAEGRGDISRVYDHHRLRF